jgi:hypothetical protein
METSWVIKSSGTEVSAWSCAKRTRVRHEGQDVVVRALRDKVLAGEVLVVVIVVGEGGLRSPLGGVKQ